MSFNRHSHARQNEETDWNPPALWNPNAAAAWSLLFTPVFGAALHMLNARAMGDERLKKLNKWFLIGFVLLVPIVEAGAILYAVLFKFEKDGILDMIFFIFPTPLFTTFLIWYIAAGRRQAALVAEQYGSNYPRRPWLKAIDLLRKYPEDLQFPNEIRKPHPKKRQGIQTAYRCNAQSAANAMPSHGGLVTYRNADIPITELGQTQAQRLAQWLREHTPAPDTVFVSPYLRTQQTARPYLEQSSLKAQVLHDLHEFNYLSFANIDGQNFTRLKQLSEAYWQRNDPDYRDGDDCDSFASFHRRIADTREHFRRLPDGNYTVFGHGFWIGLLLWQLVGRNNGIDMHHFRTFELQVRPRNTEVFLLRIDDTGSETITKIRRLHDQEHLEAA